MATRQQYTRNDVLADSLLLPPPIMSSAGLVPINCRTVFTYCVTQLRIFLHLIYLKKWLEGFMQRLSKCKTMPYRFLFIRTFSKCLLIDFLLDYP